MLFVYALFGRTGFIIVVDSGEIMLYYFLTYALLFPLLFLSYRIYYRFLSQRFNIFWREFPRKHKILTPTYAVLGIFFYIWVENIFGVDAPYNPTWDFNIGWMHIWWGDFLGFFIAIPLLMVVFHEINFAICQKTGDRHQYQFFLVVIGTSIVGTITQDWFWWISCPSNPWGPGTTIYFYFTDWIQVPLTPLYIPSVYLIVAVIFLVIIFLSTLKLYSFKQYLIWGMFPYLILVLVGNILSFIY